MNGNGRDQVRPGEAGRGGPVNAAGHALENDLDRRLARARVVLSAYGADPSRWPAAERDALRALLDATPGLAEDRHEEAALDRLISTLPAPAASPALAARILAAAENHPRLRGWATSARDAANWLAALWPFGPPWQPASAMAAAALLGLVVGATLGNGYDDSAFSAIDLIVDSDLMP
jgi:hypothetical protein